MRYRIFSLMFAALLLAAQTGLAGETFQRHVTRSFDPGSVQHLRIENLAGRVVIEGSGSGGIEMEVTVYSRAGNKLTAQEVSQLFEMEIEQDGDRLVLRSRYPVDEYRQYHYSPAKRSFFGGNSTVRYDGRKVKVSTGRKHKGLPLWADYHIRLPRDVDCNLRNVVGKVKLNAVASNCRVDCASADCLAEGQRGDLSIDSGSGDVIVKDMKGDLKIDTGSGDLEISELQGDVDADTGSGDVMLKQAAGKSLRADTGSGDVTLRNVDYPRLRVDTGSGDVEIGSPGGEVAHWEVDTGSGDVTFFLPPERTSFRLEVDTGSGDVKCDLPTKDIVVRHGEIRALTVGEGKGSITVDTGSGDVTIKKG